MAPRTSSTRDSLLTAFGLSLGMAILLTASECTTTDAARSGASTTGGAVAAAAGAPHGEDGSTDAALEAWLAPPATPAVIAVPTGAVVRTHLRGVGVQIYVCTATSATVGATAGPEPVFAWTLKAPEAKLLDASGAQVGAHGKGPSWTAFRDGSAVAGMKIAQADAPTNTAIPWLLVRANRHTGTGLFSAVTFVQRVGTVGGKVPAASTCDEAGVAAEIRVEYSADYFFFEGGA
jgi:hypothetical protein